MTKAEAVRRQRQWFTIQRALMIPFVGNAIMCVFAVVGGRSEVVVWITAVIMAASGVGIVFCYYRIQAYLWIGMESDE